MQRVGVLKKISALPSAIKHYGFIDHVPRRYLASVHEVFPRKTDFPSRHIGPRKTEVVAMLDFVGFKVCAAWVSFFLSISEIFKMTLQIYSVFLVTG